MIPSNALAALKPKGQSAGYAMYQVDSVQDDGTVNLVIGDTVEAGVPCMVGYTQRKAGDVVLVAQFPFGWAVLGKTGSEPSTAVPDTVDISWGQGVPPGGSWKKADQVWVRGNAIYAQLATSDPTPPQKPKTDPVTVTNGGSAGYWKGSRRGSTPAQGMWGSTSGTWSGAWYFGDRIVNACAGQDVASMTVSVARTSKYHGSPRGVQSFLYLVPRGTTAGPPPDMYAKFNGPKLSLGERDTAKLPQNWVNDLASGAAQGIGCDAGHGSNYLIYTKTANVTITFA